MRISFTKSQQKFEPILVNGDALEVVDSVKLLGLNISSDLTWNIHINEILKKASTRLYFLVQLKRAKVTRTHLGLFYSRCIRSIMDYAVPAFQFSFPKYLMQELEHIEKRAMSIICPGVSYDEALVIMTFKELATHRDDTCKSLFHTIVNNNNHRLYKLLPAPHESNYSLRRARPFNMPRFKIDRFKNSLRSKRFQSSYCAKVRAEAKKKKVEEGGEKRRFLLSPPSPPSFLFFLLSSRRSLRTRAETLATQAILRTVLLSFHVLKKPTYRLEFSNFAACTFR